MHKDHEFEFEVGEEVYVVDPDDMFLDGVDVMIINREYIAEIEVYSVVDHRNWTSAVRGEKLYIR